MKEQGKRVDIRFLEYEFQIKLCKAKKKKTKTLFERQTRTCLPYNELEIDHTLKDLKLKMSFYETDNVPPIRPTCSLVQGAYVPSTIKATQLVDGTMKLSIERVKTIFRKLAPVKDAVDSEICFYSSMISIDPIINEGIYEHTMKPFEEYTKKEVIEPNSHRFSSDITTKHVPLHGVFVEPYATNMKSVGNINSRKNQLN